MLLTATRRRATAALALVLVAGLSVAACARGTRPVRRLSIATGGTGGVYYPLGGALARLIGQHVPGVEATAEVTAASVDNLKFLQRGEADIAFTLADTLAEAIAGQGPFAEAGPVPARALAVLYSNATQVVARPGGGIERLVDLRGRVVSTGSPGSGTEALALRLLAAVGLDPARDIRRQSLAVAASVDAYKDGKLDAFFWSGGLPTAALLDLAHSAGGLHLLPCDAALPELQRRFGPSLYRPLTITRDSYHGLARDVSSIAVANVLVVRADFPDELAFAITRLLFERQADLVAVHAEARNIDVQAAQSGSPAPFHPGAQRYFERRPK